MYNTSPLLVGTFIAVLSLGITGTGATDAHAADASAQARADSCTVRAQRIGPPGKLRRLVRACAVAR